MKKLWVILCTLVAAQLNGQNSDSLLVMLNEPFEEQVAFHIDTMFDGQDTIFTDLDTVIYYTTPDMVIPTIDTLEYRLVQGEDAALEIDLNGDDIQDFLGIAFLAHKKKKGDLNPADNRFLIWATGNEEGRYDIHFFEDVLACPTCGPEGSEPDVSIIQEADYLSVVESWGDNRFIYNDEYHIIINDNQLEVTKHINTDYHQTTGSLIAADFNKEKWVVYNEYEEEGKERLTFRTPVSPCMFAKQIEVDGDLTEPVWSRTGKFDWRSLHATVLGERHTRNDLYAQYATGWNATHIFIGLKVTDEKLVPLAAGDEGFKGDFIHLHFDMNGSKIVNGKLNARPNGKYASIIIGFDQYGKARCYNMADGSSLGINVEFKRLEDKTGYTCEIAIAKKELQKCFTAGRVKFALEENSLLDFTIGVADSDNRETSEIENIDESSSMKGEPYKMGYLELQKNNDVKTFKEIKKMIRK